MSLAQDAGASLQPAAGSSFYVAMRILPRDRREAMMLIYGFCRAVDDVADDASSDRGQRMDALEAWRDDLESLYGGGRGGRAAPLATVIDRFALDLSDFLAVIDGMEMDVQADIKAPAAADLDHYCDCVASAVGRLSVKIFGIEHRAGLALAHHLGRALQLTNILRDLDEDAGLGRLYLAREELDRAGITSDDPKVVLAHPALANVCECVVDMALHHFAEASAVMDECPRSSVRAPRMMAYVYAAILRNLRARGWSAPRARVRTPRSRALLAALRYGLV